MGAWRVASKARAWQHGDFTEQGAPTLALAQAMALHGGSPAACFVDLASHRAFRTPVRYWHFVRYWHTRPARGRSAAIPRRVSDTHNSQLLTLLCALVCCISALLRSPPVCCDYTS